MELDEGEAAVGGVDGRRDWTKRGWLGRRRPWLKDQGDAETGTGDDGEAGTIVTDTERTRHGTSWV